jgi:peptide/nickel transport system permease protein
LSAFFLRRFLFALPLLLGALTLLFLLMQMVPGRPFPAETGALDPAAAERLRALYGVDRPAAERYFLWLGGVARGDLGFSFSERQPVAQVAGRAAARTCVLAGLAIFLQFAGGTVAGVLAAAGGRGIDRLVTGTAALLYAVPSYWLGLVLVGLFSVRLGWLPVSQMATAGGSGAPFLIDALRHLVLPCLALALPAAAGIALFVRDQVRAALEGGLTRAARSRGLGRAQVALRHGAWRGLFAASTLFGLALPGLVGGSVVIETLFAWPGMGRLAYQATLARDAPLVLGCGAFSAALVIAGSLAADLLAAAIDPRVRESLR